MTEDTSDKTKPDLISYKSFLWEEKKKKKPTMFWLFTLLI